MRRHIDIIRARLTRLRCRPGDICWVKRDLVHPFFPPFLVVRGGVVVRVTKLSASGLWELEQPVHFNFIAGLIYSYGHVSAIADELLTPLRDRPGDDETLTAKPIDRPHVQAPRQPEKVS